MFRCAAVLLAALAAGCAAPGPEEAPRITAVEAYRAAVAQGDRERARALLAEDPRVWYDERAGPGSPWNLEGGRWRAWDEHFRGRSEPVTPWVAEGDTVWADMREDNDNYRLTESSANRWRATYFFDEQDRISGFLVSGIPGHERNPGRRDEFEAWARTRHPEEAEYLMPKGTIDPTGDRPQRMRRLLEAWRAEIGLPPIPAEAGSRSGTGGAGS